MHKAVEYIFCKYMSNKYIFFSFFPLQGSLTVEDCVVHIDLNLAKVIHEKWKESIMVGSLLLIKSSFYVYFVIFNKIHCYMKEFYCILTLRENEL